eukprot:symbB.v1.2.017933.t1/scaffold1406.1/size338231/12
MKCCHLITCLLFTAVCCEHLEFLGADVPDVVSNLQLANARQVSNRSMLIRRMSNTILLSNNLYWQGYGGQTLWSYFIGFLGSDQIGLGGIVGNAKVGLNLIGNAPLGNMYQSVSTDSGMLGLLPGCFSGQCSGPEDYDDLLSTLARQGKIQRAFTMCFHDGPEGGGMLYLGKPPGDLKDATVIPTVPLTSGQTFYSPLSTMDNNAYVEFYFGHMQVGSQKVIEWNNMMRSGLGYSDTGTPGLLLPANVLTNIFKEIRDGIAGDESCQSLWGRQLQYLSVGTVTSIWVTDPAARCAQQFVKDFEVKLGPDVSVTVAKSSFFYETEPCSKQYRISWSYSGGDSIVFGTAFNYGKTVLYDTTDLASPKMVVLGPSGGCTTDYSGPGSKPMPMSGVEGQVLGEDGTITADLTVGTPPQQITVQLDTGSQKLMGIHHTCRNLGNCFLVQPVDGKNTELLPGNEYHTAVCQTQLQAMSKALSQQSCFKMKDKTLCECTDQESCLSLVMKAASQNVVPKKICAISRKICGDRVDFEPEHSSTFKPSEFPTYPFQKPPGKQSLTTQCHLQHLCDEYTAPLGNVGNRQQNPYGDYYSSYGYGGDSSYGNDAYSEGKSDYEDYDDSYKW